MGAAHWHSALGGPWGKGSSSWPVSVQLQDLLPRFSSVKTANGENVSFVTAAEQVEGC